MKSDHCLGRRGGSVLVWDHRSPACVRVQGRFVIQGRLVAIALRSEGPGAARCHNSDACACTCVEVDGSFFHACGRLGGSVCHPAWELGWSWPAPAVLGGPGGSEAGLG